MADVDNEAAPAAAVDPAGDQRQRQHQSQQQRAPPAARVNRGTEGNGGGGGGGTRDPLINMRDRLFHTLFYRLTLTYARACPKPMRRLLETLILIKVRFHPRCRLKQLYILTCSQSFQAILCFFMLVYIHVKFTRNPVHCLEGVKDTWPRDGILRVEIMRDAPDDYDVESSYEKERLIQFRNRATEDLSLLFAALSWDQK